MQESYYGYHKSLLRIRLGLGGPQNPSWLFYFVHTVNSAVIITDLYERWAIEYGPVYKVPHVLGPGLSKVILS
ncbi:hypothetical protein P692DRAFT_20737403 [Suillus brevipes Sb2]|jgi:hypothetical protein|nr:hypothetical protein P692DRAFT_20737403 [Suillus brevipes Sb2]